MESFHDLTIRNRWLRVCTHKYTFYNTIQGCDQHGAHTVMIFNIISGPRSPDPPGRGLWRQDFPREEGEWTPFTSWRFSQLFFFILKTIQKKFAST